MKRQADVSVSYAFSAQTPVPLEKSKRSVRRMNEQPSVMARKRNCEVVRFFEVTQKSPKSPSLLEFYKSRSLLRKSAPAAILLPPTERRETKRTSEIRKYLLLFMRLFARDVFVAFCDFVSPALSRRLCLRTDIRSTTLAGRFFVAGAGAGLPPLSTFSRSFFPEPRGIRRGTA